MHTIQHTPLSIYGTIEIHTYIASNSKIKNENETQMIKNKHILCEFYNS